MIDVLAETLQKLTARRGLLAREIAILDEAIIALQTVTARPGPVPPSTSPGPIVPASPRRCALESCGKLLPPQVRIGGRPRIYCDTRCKHRSLDERQAAAIPAVPPPSLRHCGAKACGKVLPPPVRPSGRPRLYCNDTCSRRAFEERKAPQPPPAPPRQPGRGSKWAQSTEADDGEDPTDRAIRMHRELHPMPESASGMRSRAKAAR